MKYYDEVLLDFSVLNADCSDIKNDKKFERKLRNDICLPIIKNLKKKGIDLFSDDKTVADKRKTIADYYSRYLENTERKNTEFREIASQLTAGDSFTARFEDGFFFQFVQVGSDVHLNTFYSGDSVINDLILQKAEFPEMDVYLDWFELSKSETGFLLEMVTEEKEHFSIDFADAVEVNHPMNALDILLTSLPDIYTPWDYLCRISVGIANHIEQHSANEKELALYSLVTYFKNSEKYCLPPHSFMELAEKFGAEKTVERYKKSKSKLFRELSKQKYEPLWREIYRLFAESQEGLPTETELRYSEESLQKHREFVTGELKKHGFEGKYPCFYKNIITKKPRILKLYGKTSFVGSGEHLKCYVICQECFAGYQVGMEFFCGTVISENQDEKTDLFSCMFDRGGKTAFSYIAAAILGDEEPTDEFVASRKDALSAAAKSAQLLRLSRKERFYRGPFPVKKLLFFMFLFMAFFFGLSMTVGFMIIEFLVTLIFTGSLSVATEIFTETPWWLIAVGTGVLFGLIMVILEIVQKRKN